MTWCSVQINNPWNVNVTSLSVRGTDWSWPGSKTIGPASPSNYTPITSMGCPGHSESDHWGWLYLYAKDSGGAGFGIYFYVFFRLKDSGHIGELGGDRAKMTKNSDQPDDVPDNRGVDNGGDKATKTFNLDGRTVTLKWTPDKDNDGSPKIEIDVSAL